MDFIKQINELLDKIKLSNELIEMNNDIFTLKKYLNILLLMKDRFNKGDITKGVNISIEPFNKKYGTNFKCEKDEEFVIVLTNMIKHIDEIGLQILNKKIEEKIIKKLMNY